jgi:hypothetical protein
LYENSPRIDYIRETVIDREQQKHNIYRETGTKVTDVAGRYSIVNDNNKKNLNDYLLTGYHNPIYIVLYIELIKY